MARYDGISWSAPTIILGGLIVGSALAVGHHFFYASLDGSIPPHDVYVFSGLNISKQQVYLAAGTAFAFLVKACLSTALYMAYVQILWRKIKHGKREVAVARVDHITSVFSNPLHLFRPWTWWRFPLLLLLAVLSWLLPLATLLPPATLSVQTTLESPPPTSMQVVPNVDFASLACFNTLFGAQFSPYYNEAHYSYNGPSPALSALAGIVAATGNTSAVLPPSRPNASWTFDFAGPALSCESMPADEVRAVQKILSHSEDNFIGGAEFVNPIAYLSWSTGLGRADNSACTGSPVLSFAPGGNSSNFMPTCMAMGNNTVTSLFMGLIPNYGNESGTGIDYSDSTWLRCYLKNATYYTNFTFVNGVQSLDYEAVLNDNTPELAIGNLSFVASEGIAFPPVTLLRRLSYQAVFDAFQQLFIGVTDGGNLYEAASTTSPGILNTIIAQRPELQFLDGTQTTAYGGSVPLTSYLRFENGTLIPGLQSAEPVETSGTLIDTMEELFTKLVVSLLSVDELQSNASSPFAVTPVKVTYNEYRTTYVYSAAKLWISYGLAVGTTAFAAVIGLYGLLANGASYNFNFSTILRMVRNARMSEDIKSEDEEGRDPLPSYLAKAHIWLSKTSKDLSPADDTSSHVNTSAHTPLLAMQGFGGSTVPRPLPQLPVRNTSNTTLFGRARK